METSEQPLIGRRNFLRLGTFAGLAIALSPLIRIPTAEAQEVCNAPLPSTGADALAELMAGNVRWVDGTQNHPGEGPDRRSCLASNPQTPFAAIISCSDSRVPPELLFDQGLGDLFVARVAGNGGTGTLAEGLYYGTNNLGARLLFVLGHSNCGAVSAAVNSYPKHNLEFVRLIFPAVRRARKLVRRAGGDPTDPSQVIPVATNQNVIMEVKKLRKSKFFKKAVNDGSLLVAGGLYDLGTQAVSILIQ